jgi:hypothetical protein
MSDGGLTMNLNEFDEEGELTAYLHVSPPVPPMLLPTEGTIALEDEAPIQPHIWRAFQKWLKENPKTYQLFKDLGWKMYCIDYARMSEPKGSISLLTERIRWEVNYEQCNTANPFKISNNMRSCIARQLMVDVPAMAGYFTTHSSVGRGPLIHPSDDD